ncbi:MAG: hypothetical protein KBT36_18075 [Kurthia sp.]|nr:hypothetical protein [Candidatus Kurthia equi]
MSSQNVIEFGSSQTLLASAINQNVNAILNKDQVVLPDENSALVRNYVKQIEGEYNLTLAKQDTDNAIELIYITYNTIPQKMGAGRAGLDEIQSSLLKAQKNAKFKMGNAKNVSKTTKELISRIYPKWVDVLEDNTPKQFEQNPEKIEELKDFLELDLVPFTKKIEANAKAVAADLDSVSDEYEQLVEQAGNSSKKIQSLLAKEINERADLLKAIDKDKANQKKYNSLVKSISDEIDDLKKQAAALEAKAETAENRAFTMGIWGAVIGGISGLVPVAVSIYNPIVGAMIQGAKSSQTATTQEGQGSSEPAGKSDAKAREASAIAEKRKQEANESEINSDIEALEDEDKEIKSKLEAGEIEAEAEIESKNIRREEIKLQLKELATKKKAIRFEIDRLDATITGIRGDLNKLSGYERDAASKFYAKQDVILSSISDLNKIKRENNAELEKLKYLIKSYKLEKNSLDISITSLNISVKAIKQCKAIIDSMAFFFRNFATFMHETRRLAENQIENLEDFLGRKSSRIKAALLEDIIDTTYNFFIIQMARWLASAKICESFEASFNEGWSKLNQLSGHYITEAELPAYLEKVSEKISLLVANRNALQDQEDQLLDEKIKEDAGRISA